MRTFYCSDEDLELVKQNFKEFGIDGIKIITTSELNLLRKLNRETEENNSDEIASEDL